MIGIVLNGMMKNNIIQRNEIILSTKVGYFHSFEEEKFKNVKKLGNEMYHCLSTDYISYSINESLKRLNIQQIDILFIQLCDSNPQVMERNF
jgi:aryl-alcohol dehydrogenase-like predicted oxidoreductase